MSTVVREVSPWCHVVYKRRTQGVKIGRLTFGRMTVQKRVGVFRFYPVAVEQTVNTPPSRVVGELFQRGYKPLEIEAVEAMIASGPSTPGRRGCMVAPVEGRTIHLFVCDDKIKLLNQAFPLGTCYSVIVSQ